MRRLGHPWDPLPVSVDVVQDPAVWRVKVIAEPWDVAEGGCRVGRTKRNGRRRDTVRDVLVR